MVETKRTVGVRTIIRSGIWEYEKTRALPPHIRKAARRIFKCKTQALGQHVYRCENGHEHARWNSCRHRSCPDCAWPAKKRWLTKTEGRIIHCPHHHIIFTFASELNDLWLANPVEMKRLLFKAVKATLIEFFGDEQYCGAMPGVIAVLHTWGRALPLHPHLHCIVTSGGVDADGKWRGPRRKSALPIPPFAVSALFKGKLLAAIRRGLDKQRLQLPEGCTLDAMKNLIASAYDKKWSVFVGRAGTRVQTIINYLGRYVCGGPIGNGRIMKCANGIVTFMHRNYRAKDALGRPMEQPMTLTTHEFLRRWFLHVPLPYSKLVRSFGIYSPSYKGERPAHVQEHYDNEGQADETPSASRDVMKCSECGAPLKLVCLTFPNRRDRGPPLGRLG